MRIGSPSGLSVQANANGSIRRIDHGHLMLNAFLGNEVEGGPLNLYLRRRGTTIAWTPLLGPRSPGAVRVDAGGLQIEGEWQTLRFGVTLVLAQSAPAWIWHVAIENGGREPVEIDLIHAQDVALADYGMVRLNEYYASQYVDYTPLSHPQRGTLLAVRQNLAMGGRHPWLMLGSLRRAVSFCTDALQLHGLSTRAGGAPAALCEDRLPGTRRQHEHSMAVLQDEPLRLAPDETAHLGFFAWFEADHAEPSSADDIRFAERALALPEAAAPRTRNGVGAPRAATLFSDAPLLSPARLDAKLLTAELLHNPRLIEPGESSGLSYFDVDAAHVVLPEKERAILRPHGQILRTGNRLEPDEASLTSTMFMDGVFHSMITQGHVSINRFLSTTHSYLGLFRSHGQRMFVEHEGRWQLLAVPSAFHMSPHGARWLYRYDGRVLDVRAWAAPDRHELWLSATLSGGEPCRFLVSNHVALNGDDGAEARPALWSHDGDGVLVKVAPDTDLARRFPEGSFRIDPAPGTQIERIGGDELLFADGRSRAQPFVVLVTAPTTGFALRITGQLTAHAPSQPPPSADACAKRDASNAARFWREMTGGLALDSEEPEIARIDAALPWLAHDAWIHHLAPRGLEQYSGGGWGTRDVCQGPVELLLSTGRVAPVRTLLCTVFANQNGDGDWPQWFMFFDRERNIRPHDSHGDIVFWPLLALAQYLLASGDGALLDASLPFFHPEGAADAEHASVMGHVERALALIERRVVPGTQLAAYGNGDWNDALQPADPALGAQLCSAWTVTLHTQMLDTLADALDHVGRHDRAAPLRDQSAGIRADFQRLLIRDGVVAGLARFRDDGATEHWLHPSDTESGVRYSLLPMIHGVLANLFDTEQARRHVELIRDHLLGRDGARLFDRPLPYRGGAMQRFQRAETSSFFGREIGLMYTHAHLRYAEALAHLGDAEAMFLALMQVIPAGLRDSVPNARLRQSNCYTSSSDADFADRYAASAHYEAVRAGTVAFEGGWRVYSSGGGIAVRLVFERLLGVRQRSDALCIDPVLPRALDGVVAHLDLWGHRLTLRYRVGPTGHGPRALTCNGARLAFVREANPYRTGGAVVARATLHACLREGANTLDVEIA